MRIKLTLIGYALTHFMVDLACAFLLYRYVIDEPGWFDALLLYNFCAFALQMPLGILTDRYNGNVQVAFGGCLIVAGAYALVQWQPSVWAAVAAGIGNALFHVGGGTDTLNVSERRSGFLGVFVAPGALGLYFGKMWGKSSVIVSLSIVVTMLLAGAITLLLRKEDRKRVFPDNARFSIDSVHSSDAIIAVACFFVVVCLRSYLGLIVRFPWSGDGMWGTWLIGAIVLGKAAGGFAADRFGVLRTSLFSLGLATLLFFIAERPAAGIAAMFLFNMTMPLTLWVTARILRNAKGFSFGLLTFGLFLGFLPVYLGIDSQASSLPSYALIAFLSLLLFYAGMRKMKT